MSHTIQKNTRDVLTNIPPIFLSSFIPTHKALQASLQEEEKTHFPFTREPIRKMTCRDFISSDQQIPITPSKPTKKGESDDDQLELQGKPSKTQESDDNQVELQGQSPTTLDIKEEAIDSGATPEDYGRDRLKRHRVEVAGRVWIPERWGHEELLKDWIDCSAFNASLVPSKIMLARAALVKRDDK